MVILLTFVVIFATGNNLVITAKDIIPYREAFYKVYQHYPKNRQEKMEVLMNCLSDRLLLLRAEELKVTKNPEFQKEWERIRTYIRERCKRENMPASKCSSIEKRMLNIAKIQYIIEREVLPLAFKEAESEEWMIEVHQNLKDKLPPNRIKGYILEVSKLKAFQKYIENLMKHYKVKVNKKALENL